MLEVRQPTHKELFEIKYYLGLDDQNLHSLYKLYLKPETSGSIFTSGQAPHQNYESHLQQIICGQWHLCKQVNNPNFANPTHLIVAIADILMESNLPFPVPALLIATTIVKAGAHKFCRCRNLSIMQLTKQ